MNSPSILFELTDRRAAQGSEAYQPATVVRAFGIHATGAPSGTIAVRFLEGEFPNAIIGDMGLAKKNDYGEWQAVSCQQNG